MAVFLLNCNVALHCLAKWLHRGVSLVASEELMRKYLLISFAGDYRAVNMVRPKHLVRVHGAPNIYVFTTSGYIFWVIRVFHSLIPGIEHVDFCVYVKDTLIKTSNAIYKRCFSPKILKAFLYELNTKCLIVAFKLLHVLQSVRKQVKSVLPNIVKKAI